MVPRPAPSSGQALVPVHRVGVCGSDFHALAGRHPIYTYPRVLGHELAGEIVEVPENPRGLCPGDRCAVDLSTKVGKYTKPGSYGDDTLDYSRTRIRKSLEESAERLGTD